MVSPASKGEGSCDRPSLNEMFNSPKASTVVPVGEDTEMFERMKDSTLGIFRDYKIMDRKPVTSQVQDLQDVLHVIQQAGGIVLSESEQVAAIIEKLPPSWTKFKNYLNLEKSNKEMKLEDLVVQLKKEEANCAYDQNEQRKQLMEPKDLMVQLKKEEVNRASDGKKHGKHIIKAKANIVEKETGANKRKRENTKQGPKVGKSKKFKQ